MKRDGITILHTIGGDDTSTTAADLAEYLADNGYELTVVGLPKTVDNDIVPIRQSLGAVTAAEQGAIFFENVVNEATRQPAHAHRPRGDGAQLRLAHRRHRATPGTRALEALQFLPEFNLRPERKAIDAHLRAGDCDRHRGGGRATEAASWRRKAASASSSARARTRGGSWRR